MATLDSDESDGRADRVERGQRDHDQPGDGAQRDEHAQRRPDLADSSLQRRTEWQRLVAADRRMTPEQGSGSEHGSPSVSPVRHQGQLFAVSSRSRVRG